VLGAYAAALDALAVVREPCSGHTTDEAADEVVGSSLQRVRHVDTHSDRCAAAVAVVVHVVDSEDTLRAGCEDTARVVALQHIDVVGLVAVAVAFDVASDLVSVDPEVLYRSAVTVQWVRTGHRS